MTQMIESIANDIMTVFRTIFYMFKKIEGSLSMLIRNTEDLKKKKDPDQISREKNIYWDDREDKMNSRLDNTKEKELFTPFILSSNGADEDNDDGGGSSHS